MPLQPKLLNYENTQFLLIGHGDDALEKAAKPQVEKEEEQEKETPLEEIEKLEDEDEVRVQHLKGELVVAHGLGLQANTRRRRFCFHRPGSKYQGISEGPDYLVRLMERSKEFFGH